MRSSTRLLLCLVVAAAVTQLVVGATEASAEVQTNVQRFCAGNPNKPPNGGFRCEPILIGSTCTATCDTGFVGAPTVGAPTSTCIAYKLNNKSWGWGEVVGRCTPANVECTNSPTNPANGAFKVCNNPTALQGTCGGDCGSGYTGSLTATCTAPNTWTITNNCAKIECTNSPPNPTNAIFGTCSNPTAFGDPCGGSCGSGFTGSLSATCTAPNTWTITNNCVASCTPPGQQCDLFNPGACCNRACFNNIAGNDVTKPWPYCG